MSERGRAERGLTHRVSWWRPAAGLGAVALTATGVVLGTGTGCVNDADLCHPDEGIPPPGICDYPDAGDGGDASDAGDAADDAPIPACPGQCVPGPPGAWDLPSVVWIGPEFEAPPCPDTASKVGYEGHTDLNAPNICGVCQCDPPTGSCGLPTTITAYAATCATTTASTVQTPFDPPAGGWDGGCTANDAVAAGQLCGNGPCVESLTIAPLAVNETGCTPTQLPIPKDSPATWNTFARMCRGFPFGACDVSGDVCTAPLAPGFRRCVFRGGDQDCSVPWLVPYTEKHVFYSGFQDSRSCSPCTCGSPAGSSCSSEVFIYADDACSSVPTMSNTVDSNKPVCVDMITGAALGSKSASAPTYVPGSCQPSGGAPIGSADPIGPSTFCCIPSP